MSRDDLLPAGHTLTLFAMIASNFAAAFYLPALCWLTIPLAAVGMTGALSALHEAAHKTYFTGRRANELVGRFWALTILMNFSLYRREHMGHHAHFGTDLDTEDRKYILSPGSLIHALLINDHALAHWQNSWRCVVSRNGSTRARYDGCALLVVATLLVGLTFYWPAALLAVAWAPLLASLVLDNVVSLPEHAVVKGDADPVATRSMVPGRVVGFLLYHVNRHEEHHADPTVSVARRHHTERENPASSSYFGFIRQALTNTWFAAGRS